MRILAILTLTVRDSGLLLGKFPSTHCRWSMKNSVNVGAILVTTALPVV